MRSTIASLTVLAVLATAAPPRRDSSVHSIPLTKKTNLSQDGVVNVKALNAHVAHLTRKYGHTLANYEKNVGTAHPNVKAVRNAKRQTGSDPLTDDNSELWQGAISVGTPAVDFTVDFDTGSSDLFLPGSDCDSSCDGHTKYDPSQSSTSEDAGKDFKLQYGDGSTVEGEQYTDSVTVAGLTASPQILGAAKTYGGFSSQSFPPDGLMGLAWPQISTYIDTPFVNTLIAQEAVAKGEFGVKLANSGSELFIGGVDDSLAGGNTVTLKVTQQGYWQVDMDSADVSGQAAVSNLQAIVDTGTTLIVGDSDSVATFYQSIEGAKDASSSVGQGYYTFPCDSDPKVSLTFGGTAFDISSTFNLGAASQGSSDCVGGIVGQDTGIDAWIAGDVFLANVYAAFSFDDSTVTISSQA